MLVVSLFPMKLKFKKYHRRFSKRLDFSLNHPSVGFFGLVSNKCGLVDVRQVDAVRKLLLKNLKKRYKVTICMCIFADLPLTKKSSGLRMGKGVGSFVKWVFIVKKGRLLFEIVNNLDKILLVSSFFSCKNKLPLFCKVIGS